MHSLTFMAAQHDSATQETTNMLLFLFTAFSAIFSALMTTIWQYMGAPFLAYRKACIVFTFTCYTINFVLAMLKGDSYNFRAFDVQFSLPAFNDSDMIAVWK
mmetsp:Transcript_9706/g.14808  ORF Transcript_9706/g.14808 Transcript_9706/m.14808 type:complete len:102 (-) Transcript_9706:858-1163(-)